MSAPKRGRTVVTTDVAIIGAGPAGLAAATELRKIRRTTRVLVLDREGAAGGIPRHCDHPGYGIRDKKSFISGPAYARCLVDDARECGADIMTYATVTAINDDNSLDVTSPTGLLRVQYNALVLATGARERARPARLIPGDRPAGVHTTGQLQNIVHLHHGTVGKKAVVVGGELVSWSAVMTLREAGCATVLMTTEYPSAESYAAFNLAGKALFRLPIATRTRITKVIGKGQLQALEIENLDTGKRKTIECDTVVFTGDWVPDHELARAAGIELDPSTKGPLVDTALRTSRVGVFAAGNLLHPVDTADIAALDGSFVAHRVRAYLDGREAQSDAGELRILADPPFRWVSPGILRPGDPAPPRRRLLLWTDELVRIPKVTLTQNGNVVARKTLPWAASPGRVFRLPWSIMDEVDPNLGPVSVGLANAGRNMPARRSIRLPQT